jgi:multiple sugar transport system ATP-binding protein
VLREAGTTTIYVTHDQTEAMGLADRIAVLYAGRIEQIDQPADLYRHPRSMFVGGFVGSPPMNFLRLAHTDGVVRLGGLRLTPPAGAPETLVLGIRAEDLDAARAEDGFAFEVRVSEPMGSHTLVTGHLGVTGQTERQPMRVIVAAITRPAPGTVLHLTPRLDHVIWMNADTGNALETTL